jgi:ketosteroid isomerase-like protein
VYHYSEDAVFVGPGEPVVQGREALLKMARSMMPLSSVSIVPVRTEASANVAAVYGHASWVNGAGTTSASTANVRLIIVWRKEPDGAWRVAQELVHADPDENA